MLVLDTETNLPWVLALTQDYRTRYFTIHQSQEKEEISKQKWKQEREHFVHRTIRSLLQPLLSSYFSSAFSLFPSALKNKPTSVKWDFRWIITGFPETVTMGICRKLLKKKGSFFYLVSHTCGGNECNILNSQHLTSKMTIKAKNLIQPYKSLSDPNSSQKSIRLKEVGVDSLVGLSMLSVAESIGSFKRIFFYFSFET